jgi:hypothetical protein
MHSKVAIRQRPYITGKVIDVNGQVVTIEYDDAQLIPRTGQHFQSELITLASTMEGVHEGYWYPPAYEYSEPACTCGLDSVYGESHNYGHSDYCEKGKKI